jgi:hypothetical protein
MKMDSISRGCPEWLRFCLVKIVVMRSLIMVLDGVLVVLRRERTVDVRNMRGFP